MRIPLLLAALLLPLLAGCTACEPLLDVRHCVTGSTLCAAPSGVSEATWDAEDAAQWPDVDALLRGTGEGDHAHDGWTEARERAWWTYWGVDPDAEAKELFVRFEGGLYRVRVLSC